MSSSRRTGRSRLVRGGYDGFPLSSCVEAGLSGTAVMASNELGEDVFRDGEDLLVIRPEPQDVADRLAELATSPADVRRLGEATQRAFALTYSRQAQLEPRIELLRRHLRH